MWVSVAASVSSSAVSVRSNETSGSTSSAVTSSSMLRSVVISVSWGNSSLMSVAVEPVGDPTEQRVDGADVGGVQDDGRQHDPRHALDLGPFRPGHLAHLVADLAEVFDGTDA